MIDERLPTQEEKAATSQVLGSIASLIEQGSFPGTHARAVLEAINWLRIGAQHMAVPVAPPPEEPAPVEPEAPVAPEPVAPARHLEVLTDGKE